MKYVLVKYDTKLGMGRNIYCHLTFDVYLFRWKIKEKTVLVELSNYVVWREFFDYWEQLIKEKSIINKKAFNRLIF